MNDYKKEMDKLNDNKKSGKPVDKPKKCQYSGCPMLATSTVEGRHKCSFHHTSDFHHQVTLSIRMNKDFLERYYKMVKWDVSDWVEQKVHLINSKNCPIEENELHSLYLVRFYNWISEKIDNDAAVLIEQRGVK